MSGYRPPNPDAMVIRPDGSVGYRFPLDTRAILRAVERAHYGRPAEPTAAERWAEIPIAVREWLALQALGSRGLGVVSQAWADIEPHQRIKIGAKARELVGRLA